MVSLSQSFTVADLSALKISSTVADLSALKISSTVHAFGNLSTVCEFVTLSGVYARTTLSGVQLLVTVGSKLFVALIVRSKVLVGLMVGGLMVGVDRRRDFFLWSFNILLNTSDNANFTSS